VTAVILTDVGSSLIRTQGIKKNAFGEFVTNKSIISLKQTNAMHMVYLPSLGVSTTLDAWEFIP